MIPLGGTGGDQLTTVPSDTEISVTVPATVVRIHYGHDYILHGHLLEGHGYEPG